MENLRTWKEWAKYNRNGLFHKLLVLFGLRKSPTYEMHKALEPLRQYARYMQRGDADG